MKKSLKLSILSNLSPSLSSESLVSKSESAVEDVSLSLIKKGYGL